MISLLASAALADCSRPNVFAEAERAPRVAVVSVAAGGAGRIVESWKGEGAATLVFPGVASEDGFVPQSGHRYLLFLEPTGQVEVCARTLDLGVPSHRALADAVKRWLAATALPARADLLVALGAGGDEDVADEALEALGGRPDHLAALTRAHRAALVALVPGATGPRSAGLSWTLGRLHAVESVPAWVAWLGQPRTANARPVVEALQLMSNHPAAGYVRGRDVYGEDLERVRADYADWWRTWGVRPLEEAIEAGFSGRPADDALSVAVRRNRCELAERLDHSALPAGGATGAPDPACP